MKIVQRFPSTMQDDYQLNMINIIRHGVRNWARQEIVTRNSDGLFRYTYRDAYKRIIRLAVALDDLGAEIGDRIGVLEWNTYRYYEMDFGIPGTGAVLLQMNLWKEAHSTRRQPKAASFHLGTQEGGLLQELVMVKSKYTFEKRQREVAKQQKQKEKAARRSRAKEEKGRAEVEAGHTAEEQFPEEQ